MYPFSIILVKLPVSFWQTRESRASNSHGNLRGKKWLGSIFKKKRQNWKDQILRFQKLTWNSWAIKAVWSWHKNRQRGQQHRTGRTEINPYVNSQSVLNKRTTAVQQRGSNLPASAAETTGFPQGT